MDGTVFLILLALAIVTMACGLYLSRTSAKKENVQVIEQEIAEQDPPQGVSGIIPWGQAVGDYPDPEAEYDDIPRATYPEAKERNL